MREWRPLGKMTLVISLVAIKPTLKLTFVIAEIFTLIGSLAKTTSELSCPIYKKIHRIPEILQWPHLSHAYWFLVYKDNYDMKLSRERFLLWCHKRHLQWGISKARVESTLICIWMRAYYIVRSLHYFNGLTHSVRYSQSVQAGLNSSLYMHGSSDEHSCMILNLSQWEPAVLNLESYTISKVWPRS